MIKLIRVFLCFFVLCAVVANAMALPRGYTELEYIETTSRGPYINTGISPTNNTGFIIDFQYTNIDPSEQIIIGSFDPNFLIDRFSYNNDAQQRMFGYAYRPHQGLEEGFFPMSDYSLTARHVSELNWQNSGLFRFDDITRTLPANTFSNPLPIYIFSCNGLGSYGTISGRVYSVKISNNTNIVRDMVPVRRDSDGTVGMYDTVSNTFFTNAGSGSFTAGPVAGLPKGYTQLEYLESNGTQCINTGVILTSDNVTYEWNAKDFNMINHTTYDTSLFGSESDNPRYFSGILYGTTIRYGYAGETWTGSVNYNPDNDFNSWKYVISSDHTQYLIKDGEQHTAVGWEGILNKVTPIHLFCNLWKGYQITQFSSVAFKYFRIIDNGQTVFDGIPARRDSDGELGMYDTVTKTFFTNIGTGTFIAGYGIASTSYVQGMYEAINNSKMAKLNPNSIEFTADSSPYGFFTAVEGAGDKFRFKREEITLPFGSYDNPTGRMSIWLE